MMYNSDEKQKKLLTAIFQDFFKDATLKFQGRLDEGNISLKEINDYISSWIEVHFKEK